MDFSDWSKVERGLKHPHIDLERASDVLGLGLKEQEILLRLIREEYIPEELR